MSHYSWQLEHSLWPQINSFRLCLVRGLQHLGHFETATKASSDFRRRSVNTVRAAFRSIGYPFRPHFLARVSNFFIVELTSTRTGVGREWAVARFAMSAIKTVFRRLEDPLGPRYFARALDSGIIMLFDIITSSV